MPKRRKKCESARKQALDFEESPVNIVHKMPSPVFWSDHHLTANVVPVDELSPSWVSPQFRNQLCSGRVLRSRRCRNLTNSHLGGTIISCRERHPSQRRNPRLVPLQIQGMGTQSNDSVLRELRLCVDNNGQRHVSGGDSPDHMSHDAEDYNSRAEQGSASANQSRLSPDFSQLNLRTPRGMSNGETPHKTSIPLAATAEDVATSVATDVATSAAVARETGHLVCDDRTLRQMVTVGDESNCDLQGDLTISTPEFDSGSHKSLGCQGNKNRGMSDRTEEGNNEQGDRNIPFEETSMHFSPIIKHRSRKRLFETVATHSPDIANSSPVVNPPPTSRRRSLRIKLLQSNAWEMSSTPMNHVKTSNILVYDTPEEDYSLPVRLRRMKYSKTRHKQRLA